MHSTTLTRFDLLAPFRALILFMATVLVNTAHAVTTNLVSGLGGTVPKYIGWATGTQTTALVTDTSLGPTTVEKLIDLSTSAGTDHTTGTPTRDITTNANDTLVVTGTRTATGGAGGTVTAAALFDAASGGNMYCKGDFAGIALSVGDSIAFTFRIKFA